jgi:hypothetical protein
MRIRLHNNDLDSINASDKTGFFRRTPTSVNVKVYELGRRIVS